MEFNDSRLLINKICYVLDGGDGDQSFFGKKHVLRQISPTWFNNTVDRGEGYIENAKLFEIVSSGKPYEGRFVAVTSRWVMTLDEQFAENSVASVVVHLTKPSFTGGQISNVNSSAIGMSFIERCDLSKPETFNLIKY